MPPTTVTLRLVWDVQINTGSPTSYLHLASSDQQTVLNYFLNMITGAPWTTPAPGILTTWVDVAANFDPTFVDTNPPAAQVIKTLFDAANPTLGAAPFNATLSVGNPRPNWPHTKLPNCTHDHRRCYDVVKTPNGGNPGLWAPAHPTLGVVANAVASLEWNY